ncbi:H-NS family nucleoid-associated regulatory protein [Ralstonia thomasii]|uniref:Histone family protein nucleoid-structuring protein H-NS n=1 Tax=Ralstonia pickettii (strain 12J) TaxID=402626 RepID=B2UAC6_RALPJ|nr:MULTISPECIES: H-NS family nucleoid-associated regulatory protein [Ralstonia]MBT2180941.1 H-NS histone family protein [Ralstonia pickettii]
MPNRVDLSMIESSPAAMLRRRAEAIAWVRMQIARYGLAYADLTAAGCFPPLRRASSKARYRSAEGQTWDGEGDMPDWLQRAVNAGQSPEHFRVGT